MASVNFCATGMGPTRPSFTLSTLNCWDPWVSITSAQVVNHFDADTCASRGFRPKEPHLTRPPPVELERTQERHQVLLLLRIEFDAEDQVEELHGVVERQQAIVVQVRRRVLDAAQREGLDRAIG